MLEKEATMINETTPMHAEVERLLHFDPEELAARRRRTVASLREQGLDGLLLFRQESMYYLTGYDSMGYITFQCLYLGADGILTLLTRAPDRVAANRTSIIEDIRIWVDREGASPADDLRVVLAEHGCRGKRLGIESDAIGLSLARGRMVEAALDGFCTLVDASDLVSKIRVVKSEAELSYIRRAAELADDALEEVNRLAVPGTSDLRLFAAVHDTIFNGGGDYPASRFTITSGENALIVRHYTGHGVIGQDDQVQIEFAGVYRHYHACLFRTVLTGKVNERHREMHDACVETLTACQEACRPNNTVGDIFEAYSRVFDRAGFRKYRMNACGYSLGAKYPPTWMDWPMIYAGNPVVLEPNMVFFLQMILVDYDRGLTMSLGETVRVGPTGCERLSRVPWDLVVNG
jgi:Xaa-Pro dipeptidase